MSRLLREVNSPPYSPVKFLPKIFATQLMSPDLPVCYTVESVKFPFNSNGTKNSSIEIKEFNFKWCLVFYFCRYILMKRE